MEEWRLLINNAAIITAAGSSRRFGGGIKKEYQYMGEKPVLVRTILPFLNSGLFNKIIVTVPQIHIAEELLNSFISIKKIKLIKGKETRQKSVYNALQELKKQNIDYVLIHDGARPWITVKLVKSVLDKTYSKSACIPVIIAQDAMKTIKDNIIAAHLERKGTFCAQTPQGFNYKDILKAHKFAVSDNINYIDDSEMYSKYIGPVSTVNGDIENRKITYKHDLGI